MAANPLPRLRKLCLALPEAHEVIAWGEPTFRVRNKLFAMFANGSTHHGAGRHAVWCKATHVTFSPPYVGPSGWGRGGTRWKDRLGYRGRSAA